jgi:predicted transposase/invertase (TIGR01784 family)
MKQLRFVNDLVFKYIFGNEKNKKILISLLNAILKLENKNKIEKITFLNSFNLREFKDDKSTILDIKAKDETGKFYNIEMQVIPEPYYIERVLYYYSKLYGKQLKRKDKYYKLKKTISISILDRAILNNEKSIHNIYKLLNIESYKELSDHFEFHFIELSKFKIEKPKKLQTTFEKWLHVLKFESKYMEELMELPETLKNEEGIEMAIEALRYANSDEYLREIVEAREKAEHDLATRLGVSKIEGFKEGIKKGVNKGIKKEKLETAKKLLKLEVPIDIIIQSTGLTEEKIKELSNF